MKTIQRYLVTMALNHIVAEVIKSVIRAKPDMHIRYIDSLYERASHEVDRFKRLHPERKVKTDGPAGSDAGADRRSDQRAGSRDA